MRAESIGLVGSRDVGPDAIGVAEGIARAAAERGLGVVSGGAKGIDQRSMAAAVQAGTTVVGWLAESLDRRLRDPDTRRVVSEGRVALATPFKPDAGFSVANAMSRNKLIYATARVTVIVTAASGKGGTWEGAVEAMRSGSARSRSGWGTERAQGTRRSPPGEHVPCRRSKTFSMRTRSQTLDPSSRWISE